MFPVAEVLGTILIVLICVADALRRNRRRYRYEPQTGGASKTGPRKPAYRQQLANRGNTGRGKHKRGRQ
jgi:hypothetical protein